MGGQNGLLHKLWREIKAPDRAVTGQSLGVKRWMSAPERGSSFPREGRPFPFLWEDWGALPRLDIGYDRG